MARPNKFMDAAKLESWMDTEYPGEMKEWEDFYSDVLDLWDWLEIGCDTILTEFEAWYNKQD
jgi:hypothetical protein